jgi:hypothetical protein
LLQILSGSKKSEMDFENVYYLLLSALDFSDFSVVKRYVWSDDARARPAGNTQRVAWLTQRSAPWKTPDANTADEQATGVRSNPRVAQTT